jgi:hypothetical protein
VVRGWDITEQSGAPAVTTYPEWTHKFSAYYSAGTNNKHVVFQNIDGHLHDIFWVPGVKPTHTPSCISTTKSVLQLMYRCRFRRSRGATVSQPRPRIGAQHIATTGQFIHDPVNAVPQGPYGESIAGFTTGVSEPNGGQSRWVAEKINYHGGPYDPQPDTPSGHYLQMVWRNEKEIGCGTAPPGAGGLPYSILVCRYVPQGLYPGENPY